MDKWIVIALVTVVRQLLLSSAKKIQPTLTNLHTGLQIGFFHSGFPISYTLTHLHRGLPSCFFHSDFPISYTLTHLIKVVQVVSFIQASLSVTHWLTYIQVFQVVSFIQISLSVTHLPIYIEVFQVFSFIQIPLSFPPYVPYILFISSSLSLWTVEIMQHVTVQICIAFFHFFLLRTKNLSQHIFSITLGLWIALLYGIKFHIDTQQHKSLQLLYFNIYI